MRSGNMGSGRWTGAAALAVLLITTCTAAAHDETKWPDMDGQWRRAANGGLLSGGNGGLRYDASRPSASDLSLGQKPPLTAEYQKIYQDNLDDMSKGGQGIDPTASCLAGGMPRIMIAYAPMEIVVTPKTTYILMERDHDFYRHIYTDGRDFPPPTAEPTFLGYSVGKWLDTDGDGRFDTLEVETRGIKGPHVYDATGIPLHADGETVIKERIYLDKADKNLLHDDITTIDHALTEPWVVNKLYQRTVTDKPIWYGHQVCMEGNNHIRIGNEYYFRSGDGQLMPTKKGQTPPDLRYFRTYNR
jgi:hypothetical protein